MSGSSMRLMPSSQHLPAEVPLGRSQVLSTGTGPQERWYVARLSLAGLLADGPYRSAWEARAALRADTRAGRSTPASR